MIRKLIGKITNRIVIKPSEIRLSFDQAVRSLHYQSTRESDK